MCRVVGYLGRPIVLTSILYATDSSLVRQAYSPRMMATFLNLAGVIIRVKVLDRTIPSRLISLAMFGMWALASLVVGFVLIWFAR